MCVKSVCVIPAGHSYWIKDICNFPQINVMIYILPVANNITLLSNTGCQFELDCYYLMTSEFAEKQWVVCSEFFFTFQTSWQLKLWI